jgi:hypothetical protein
VLTSSGVARPTSLSVRLPLQHPPITHLDHPPQLPVDLEAIANLRPSVQTGDRARPPSSPTASPRMMGTARESCTKTRAGTPQCNPDTGHGRSRSRRARNQGIDRPARRRIRASTRTGVRSAPPTAPSHLRTTTRQDDAGVSREGSSGGSERYNQWPQRRSASAAAWTSLTSMPVSTARVNPVPSPECLQLVPSQSNSARAEVPFMAGGVLLPPQRPWIASRPCAHRSASNGAGIGNLGLKTEHSPGSSLFLRSELR